MPTLAYGLIVLAVLVVIDALLPARRSIRIVSALLTAFVLMATAGVAILLEPGVPDPLADVATGAVGLALVALVALSAATVRIVLAERRADPGTVDAPSTKPSAPTDEPAEPAAPVVSATGPAPVRITPPEAPASAADDAMPGHPPVAPEAMLSAVERVTERAGLTLFQQDRDLVYRWIMNPRLGWVAETVVGRSETELIPPAVLDLTRPPKLRALETGEPEVFSIDVEHEGETIAFLVDVVPVDTPAGEREIVCLATDVTRQRQLESARAELSRRLSQTLRQLRLTLRSGGLQVASQDRDLVYHWSSGGFAGFAEDDIVGRSDEDLLPPEDRDPVIAVKRQVIETGAPASQEVGIGTGPGRRHFELHVEPDIDDEGKVAGITTAAVDVTVRRRNEEQLRHVLRELTHRTKNLLAVTIAIARQTAAGSGSVKAYVDALTGRLRALSAAQDLIVADNWGGVDLAELVWLQVAQSQGPEPVRFDVDGPRVTLTPEVSQNLGLAIHELAVNALRHGAFSVPGGRVRVDWRQVSDGGRRALALSWREEGGPAVDEPRHRGFGLSILERTLARSLDAGVVVAFEPAGLTARITIPLAEGITVEDD